MPPVHRANDSGVQRWRGLHEPVTRASNGALLPWDYTMVGVVALHWTLVLTIALGCFLVRVMKEPAYVADAYPLPSRPDATPAGRDATR